MTNVFPNSNLASSSQPWGREVQKRLEILESQLSLQKTNSATVDAQLQSSYRRIDNTLNGIVGLGASGSGYTINADNINGGTITGTTLQTSADGQRVVVSNLDEIKFYGESGDLSLTMEGTGTLGDSAFVMYSKSLLNTALGTPGSSIIIADSQVSISSHDPDSWDPEGESGPGSGLYLDGLGEVLLVGDVDITIRAPLIELEGPVATTGEINAGGNVFGATLTAKNNGSISGGSVYTTGQIDADGNLFGATVTAKNGGGIFGGSLSTTGAVSAGTSVTSGGLIQSGGNMRSGGTLGRVELDGGGTTGASINTNGNIIRTSSSERYKQDIDDLNVDYEDLLLLSPKKFRLKQEVNGDDEVKANANARYYAGFIAEEIAETPLSIFVSYERLEDGTERPDGVYYAELTTALLQAIKHQDTLIKSLTERIVTLENDKV
jgi:hypothetical protein